MVSSRTTKLSVALGCLVLSYSAHAQHAGDIVVGRSGSNQLKFQAGDEIHLLGPVNGPFLFGWTGDEPGFEHLEADEPGEDFFMLGAGAEIRVECLGISPALKGWAPGFGSVLDGPGDQILLGDEELHAHLTWHIDTQDPGYSNSQTIWEVTLRLVDTGSTNYWPSQSFLLRFSNPQSIPTVAEWGIAIMVLGILVGAGLVIKNRGGRFQGTCIQVIGALLAVAILPRQVKAQHAHDIWIGQSGGKVAVHPAGFTPGSEYNELIRVDQAPFFGWSNNEPGFDAATTAQGAVSPLTHGPEIWLRAVSLDPALLVIGSGVMEFPGDEEFLGGHDLHAHLTFFVEEEHPQFDEHECVWQGTFKLVDKNRILSDSDPFSLLLSTIPVRHEDDPADGRFDGDFDVDSAEHKAFSVCMAGPGLRPDPQEPAVTTCEVECHNSFDFDNDLDVDLLDFAQLAVEFGR